MKLRLFRLLVMAIAIWSVAAAAGAAAPPAPVRVGGTGFALGIMKILAESFEKSHPGVKVKFIPSLGSTGGIKAFMAGALDIALSGRPLTAAEKSTGAVAHEIARSPFVFIAHNKVSQDGVSSGDLEKIYGGRLSAWPDGSRIRLVLRPVTEIDTQLLRSISPVMERALSDAVVREGMIAAITDQENLQTVAKTPGAIGGSSLTQVLAEKQPVKILSFNGIVPSVKGLRSGSYPLYKALYLVTAAAASAQTRQFVAFINSKAGAALLTKYGNQTVDR